MTDPTTVRPKAEGLVRIDEPHVRVTEWRFAPGAETGWHRHGADYVVVPLLDGDLLLEEPGGTSRTARLTRHVPYARPEGVEHNVVNANAFDYAFVEVEMLRGGSHAHGEGADGPSAEVAGNVAWAADGTTGTGGGVATGTGQEAAVGAAGEAAAGAPDPSDSLAAARRAMLARFVDAWNAHDLAAVMASFTDDCVFLASAGPTPEGAVHVGRAAVEAATAAIFAAFPDAAWTEGRTTLFGDRALWEWVFTGTGRDGVPVRVAGMDVLDLAGDKVARKNSFRKAVTRG